MLLGNELFGNQIYSFPIDQHLQFGTSFQCVVLAHTVDKPIPTNVVHCYLHKLCVLSNTIFQFYTKQRIKSHILTLLKHISRWVCAGINYSLQLFLQQHYTVIICAYITSFSCSLLLIYSSEKRKIHGLYVVAPDVKP